MSEKDTQQQAGNKYGIDRSKITRAKGYKPFPGANRQQQQSDGQEKKESRFKLDTYQKVIVALTVIASLIYCGVYALNQNGYMLINTTTQYWLWFAVVICVILLVGRFIMKIPKSNLSKKSTKISVAVVSVILIFMTYLSCVESIEGSWHQCAEIESEDGRNSVVVMRIDVDIPEPEAEAEATPVPEATDGEYDVASSYTLYSAYPRINSLFCDSSARDNLIMIEDGKDVELKMEWIDGDLKLFVEEKALEGMESILVELD